jgi:hypothetical protein
MPRESSPSADWNFLHRLENAASCIHYINSTPALNGAVKGLIECGHLRDITRAAECIANAGALADRLMAAIAAATKTEPSGIGEAAPGYRSAQRAAR